MVKKKAVPISSPVSEQRHKNMAAIRSKNTKPEMAVRRWLWKNGFRYRLNSPRLPGHPDLVLRKYRTCIFVNGCFWHGHHVMFPTPDSNHEIADSACCRIPHTNRECWVTKISRNQRRDVAEQLMLAKMGWHCITVWECELSAKVREKTLTSLGYTLNHIWLADHAISRDYPPAEEQDGLMAAEDLADKSFNLRN